MTRAELKKSIKELEKELRKCEDSKRRTFLKATINLYSKKLGLEAPYKW